MGETIFEENFRRTGARLFGGSGAVGDDPLVWIEFTDAWFEFDERDRQRPRDVIGCIRTPAADIQENGCVAVESRLALFNRYPLNLLWYFYGWTFRFSLRRRSRGCTGCQDHNDQHNANNHREKYLL